MKTAIATAQDPNAFEIVGRELALTFVDDTDSMALVEVVTVGEELVPDHLDEATPEQLEELRDNLTQGKPVSAMLFGCLVEITPIDTEV